MLPTARTGPQTHAHTHTNKHSPTHTHTRCTLARSRVARPSWNTAEKGKRNEMKRNPNGKRIEVSNFMFYCNFLPFLFLRFLPLLLSPSLSYSFSILRLPLSLRCDASRLPLDSPRFVIKASEVESNLSRYLCEGHVGRGGRSARLGA